MNSGIVNPDQFAVAQQVQILKGSAEDAAYASPEHDAHQSKDSRRGGRSVVGRRERGWLNGYADGTEMMADRKKRKQLGATELPSAE